MAHVAQYKKDSVEELVKLIEEYPIVGCVNMANLPAPQLQNMRAQLRESVVLKMSKRRLITIALDQAKEKKPGIEKLKEHLSGMPALIFTKDNPFSLNKVLDKNKSSAPAKAGQTAPNDIIVNKGPTPFAPGPIIGELGSIGVKAGVENGKVAIKEDTAVCKRGEEIKQKVAELLTRLGIEPMEVGLDLMAAYENGILYSKDVLSIDEKTFALDMASAARWSFNLAMYIEFPTALTIEPLIGKAQGDARALGREQRIFDKGIVEELLETAERSMLGLKNAANV